jgi:hypothetical protein
MQSEDLTLSDPANASDFHLIEAAMSRKNQLEEEYFSLLEELENLQDYFDK